MNGGEKVRGHFIRIEIPQGRIKEIMDRLDKAQEEIQDCYCELARLGVVTIKEAPSKDDAPED